MTEDAGASGVLVITAAQAHALADALGPVLASAKENAELDLNLAGHVRTIDGLRRMLARTK